MGEIARECRDRGFRTTQRPEFEGMIGHRWGHGRGEGKGQGAGAGSLGRGGRVEKCDSAEG